MTQSIYLVTGAAGFIGSHLCQLLLGQGAKVVGIDNFNDFYSPEQKRRNLQTLGDHPDLTFYEADICDQPEMQRIVQTHRPTAIAHLAALANVRYSIGRAALYTKVNITASVDLLELAREFEVDNFVFASTSSIYGHTTTLPFVETDACNHPLAPYPASKKAVEIMGYTYHNLHQMNFTAVRFFSVYGPHGRPDMMPYMITDRINTGEPIINFDNGQMKRDWTYVKDIAAGVALALQKPLGYEIINLGRGEPVLMADFITILEKLMGKKANLESKPAPPSEPKITFADITKARKLLGYDPQTSVDEGLTAMVYWYRRTH